jgi:glyoxylase-like metal-dependent hydrolase (beta-lactamase superfamily II)
MPLTAAMADPLHGLTVLERGWLSSNNLLVHPAPGEAGAVLFDSGHLNHAGQTVALLRHALARGGPAAPGGAPPPLRRIVNTHLHSDHCGGNAAVQAAFGAVVSVPPGEAAAARAWHEPVLSHQRTGQRLQRFEVHAEHGPGEQIVAGGRAWEVIAAPGHDTHAVLLFDRARGVLVAGDALWENGFGVVFPELDGEPGFADVAAALDTIAALPVRVVVPGHGAPFADVDAALMRARSRLAGLSADPARHARHALKVLIKYHLMEERRQPLPALLDWAEATPLVQALWQRFAPRGVASLRAWVRATVAELVDGGALARELQAADAGTEDERTLILDR